MRAAPWRLVLRRSRSEWLMVAAAWLVVLAAATLISAGVMYSDAVARSGLLRVLADAGPTEVNIQVRARVDRGTAAAADARVVEELTRTLDGLTAPIVRSGRSESFALPGQVTGEVTDLAVFGSAEGIEDHATLRAGAWPVAGQAPVQVALSEPVASRLDLAPGDELTLLSRLDPALSIAVRVAGVYRVADPADPFWWGDQLALEGVAEGRSFTVFGPLMVAREDLLTRTLVHRVELSWRTFPTLDQIEPQALTSLRARVVALPNRLEAALEGSETVQVDTGLGPLLDRASASLLVSGTGVLLLNVQLAILAGYALLLVAGLIVEQRRAESALLRSRGASTGNLAWFALLEGLVMVVPAAILGPLLAVGLLHAFNVVGPLAGSGVRLEPRLGESAVLSSAVAATAALFGLVVPAVISAGPLAGIRRSFGRQVGRTFAHRMGLDIALVALAVIGLWQLNRYGAPLTRSLRGTLGADPLLVAAPAIGLLAGAVLALRLVPLLGRALEELLAHRRGLVSSLGARQLARRPLRYTRSALLLMVASAIGFFAGAYSATWGESQRDQVDYEVAADVRVISPGSAESPMWTVAGAYARLPAGAASLPVLKDSFDLGQFGGRGTLVALDSSRASAVVAFRPDLADVPLGELMGRLEAGRPNVDLASLPGFPARVGLDLEVGLEALLTDEYPGRIPSGGSGASVAAIVRDAAGLIHRFAGDTADLRDGTGRVVVPLETPAEEATARTLAYPLELLAIEVVLRVPERAAAAGSLRLSGVSVSERIEGDGWVPVALDQAGGDWTVVRGGGVGAPVPVPPSATIPGGVSIDPADPLVGPSDVEYGFVPAGLAGAAEPLRALVNDRFLEATATRPGDRIGIGDPFAEPLQIEIAGVVRGFPTVDPERPLAVLDLTSLSLSTYATGGTPAPVGEWWVTVPDVGLADVTAALAGGQFTGSEVQSRARETNARLTDPIALGVVGALSLGAAGAALFAAVGFVVSTAVAARERLAEFALLRALGLTPSQLSAWLSFENAFLLTISLATGVGLGAVLSMVVLPTVTLTQAATTVVPPVRVSLPWEVALVFTMLGILALLLTVLILGRLVRRAGLGTVLRMGDE